MKKKTKQELSKEDWKKRMSVAVAKAYRKLGLALGYRGRRIVYKCGRIVAVNGISVNKPNQFDINVVDRWWTVASNNKQPIRLSVLVRPPGSPRARYFTTKKDGQLPYEAIADAVIVLLKVLKDKQVKRQKDELKHKQDKRIKKLLFKKYPQLKHRNGENQSVYLDNFSDLTMTIRNLSFSHWLELCGALSNCGLIMPVKKWVVAFKKEITVGQKISGTPKGSFKVLRLNAGKLRNSI